MPRHRASTATTGIGARALVNPLRARLIRTTPQVGPWPQARKSGGAAGSTAWRTRRTPNGGRSTQEGALRPGRGLSSRSTGRQNRSARRPDVSKDEVSAWIGVDDEAAKTVPDCRTPLHRKDHGCAAPADRAEGTSSDEGRMGDGPVRPRESARGPEGDRRATDPD